MLVIVIGPFAGSTLLRHHERPVAPPTPSNGATARPALSLQSESHAGVGGVAPLGWKCPWVVAWWGGGAGGCQGGLSRGGGGRLSELLGSGWVGEEGVVTPPPPPLDTKRTFSSRHSCIRRRSSREAAALPCLFARMWKGRRGGLAADHSAGTQQEEGRGGARDLSPWHMRLGRSAGLAIQRLLAVHRPPSSCSNQHTQRRARFGRCGAAGFYPSTRCFQFYKQRQRDRGKAGRTTARRNQAEGTAVETKIAPLSGAWPLLEV